MKESLSYIGIVTKMKTTDARNGFTERCGSHKSKQTIDLEAEEMVAFAQGPEMLIRRLESVGEALCKSFSKLTCF